MDAKTSRNIHTNNSQTILLNALIGEFIIIENPLLDNDAVQGIRLLDTNLIIFGSSSWSLLNLSGKTVRTTKIDRTDSILEMKFLTCADYSITYWSGDLAKTDMTIETYKEDIKGEPLEFYKFLQSKAVTIILSQ